MNIKHHYIAMNSTPQCVLMNYITLYYSRVNTARFETEPHISTYMVNSTHYSAYGMAVFFGI